MQKILIVGSQGYLGSKLSDYLQELGYECAGMDIGFFQYGVLYPPQKVNMISGEARTLTQKDLESFNVVIMLAGISNDPFGNLSYEKIYDPTREYAINIAKLCKKMGIKFIFPSSCSVYGFGNKFFNEDSPTNPLTPYSLNKLQIEQDLTQLASKDFSPIALRFGTVFGASPRIRFDLVINMLCGMAISEKKVVLNSNGQAWRPHVHIDDVCESFRCCIEWDYNDGKLMVLNIGRDENNWKVIDIAKLIQSTVKDSEFKMLGQSLYDDDLIKDRKVQDGVDKRSYQVSFERAYQNLPGFQAKWTVESGIADLIDNLNFWKLNQIKFKQRECYRLQQIEFLYETKLIDENLKFS